MSSTSRRIRRGLFLALLLAAVAVVVSRLRAPVGRHAEVLPSIGGDTWPPVPVKDAGVA
jgi:hypothetical protein